MKVYVRHGQDEMMFPSFKDFQSMYRLKFIAPDDLCRREFSDRWIPVKDLPELRSVHLYDRDGGKPWIRAAIWALAGLMALLVLVRLMMLWGQVGPP